MMALKVDRQSGLSMVELLVALAISSFLILGITQVYIDNKRSYMFQQSQASNQENTRFAELMLNGWLGKAGYRRAPDQAIEDAFPVTTAEGECSAFVEGAAITGLESGTGFCIRYQPISATELDCQGNEVNTITNTKIDKPFVKTDPEELVVMAIQFVPSATELDQGALQCKNLSGTTPAFVEILDGVADVRFEFAVGEDDLFEKKLKDSSPWSNSAAGLVRAVRYSILLASRPNQRETDSKVYTDWIATLPEGADKERIENADNQRVYQVASGTQVLRNLMP